MAVKQVLLNATWSAFKTN